MPDLATTEADKYERMWARPEYRRHSPGALAAKEAYSNMLMKRGDTLADFGCGSAKASKWFALQHLFVFGFDIADNATSEEVKDWQHTPHVGGLDIMTGAALWELVPPRAPLVDWGFCADVMEHIPPEKVDETLSVIARLVRRAIYFQICTQPDGCGKLIGETLHLSVHPTQWWDDTLREHFTSVQRLPASPTTCTFIAWSKTNGTATS